MYLAVMAWISTQEQNAHHWPGSPHVDKGHTQEEEHLEQAKGSQTFQEPVSLHLQHKQLQFHHPIVSTHKDYTSITVDLKKNNAYLAQVT